MPRIDAYLENLARHGARTLILASGRPVQLGIGDETKSLRKSCTAEEILALVHEIMDADARRGFVVASRARFAYRSLSVGPVTVEVERQGSLLRCEVALAPGAREPLE